MKNSTKELSPAVFSRTLREANKAVAVGVDELTDDDAIIA
jgi:hypothetical protein